MALHNATDRMAVAVLQGRRCTFTYRYETWVQFPVPAAEAAGRSGAVVPGAQRAGDRQGHLGCP